MKSETTEFRSVCFSVGTAAVSSGAVTPQTAPSNHGCDVETGELAAVEGTGPRTFTGGHGPIHVPRTQLQCVREGVGEA